MIHGATEELVTVRDWLRWSVTRFRRSRSARSDTRTASDTTGRGLLRLVFTRLV